MSPSGRIDNPALFICDLQEKFRDSIYEFGTVIATAQKLLRASQVLKVPVYVTTQNRSRLGDTVPELPKEHAKIDADKTLFSMMVPEVEQSLLLSPTYHSVAIVGIESHICVLQTAIDLLSQGHKVYIIADGVSSCNKQEIPIALARLRSEGAKITTSESWMYEIMGDASIEEFRQIAQIVKETKQSTTKSLQALL